MAKNKFLDDTGLLYVWMKVKELFISKSSIGTPDGIASLDSEGKIPIGQIPDSISSSADASDVTFDNTGSRLTSTDVQSAIDELANEPSVPDGVTYINFDEADDSGELALVDSDTLEGHRADYFATAESVTNIVDGTTVVGEATKTTFDSDDNNIAETFSNIINGTQPVGDSAKLGDKDASEYAEKKELKQLGTHSQGALGGEKGWYRIAHCNTQNNETACASYTNSMDLKISRGFNDNANEIHMIRMGATYGNYVFTSLFSQSIEHLITKIRYVYTNDFDCYIEIYYDSVHHNLCAFDVSNARLFNMSWVAIEPIYIGEQLPDGVTVYTTYDIPANTNIVTSNDLKCLEQPIIWNQLTPDNCCNTEYYNDSFVDGVHNVTLIYPEVTWARMKIVGGDINIVGHKIYVRITGDDILCANLVYSEEDSDGEVYHFSDHYGKSNVILTPTYNYLSFQFSGYWTPDTTSAQFTINTFDLTLMFGEGNEPTMEEFDRMFPDTYYAYNSGIDLSTVRGQGVKLSEHVANNYLPLSGGKVSKASGTPLEIENTATDICAIAMFGANNHLGSLGFHQANTPIMINTAGEVINLLHLGNMADYVLPISGGMVTGDFKVKRNGIGYFEIFKNHSSEIDYGTLLRDYNEKGEHCHITINASLNAPEYQNKDGVISQLLHTGNIPQMMDNVEYKTYELFHGFPVYVRVLLLGWCAEGETTIDLPADIGLGYKISIEFLNFKEGYSHWVTNVLVSDTSLRFTLPNAAGEVRAILKYTKEA